MYVHVWEGGRKKELGKKEDRERDEGGRGGEREKEREEPQ